MQGISTRSVDDLVKAMGMSGITKSQVSRLCEEIDDMVKAFLEWPIEDDWPYLWIDATYLKVRHAGRIVSAAAIIAVGRQRGRPAKGPGHEHWHLGGRADLLWQQVGFHSFDAPTQLDDPDASLCGHRTELTE